VRDFVLKRTATQMSGTKNKATQMSGTKNNNELEKELEGQGKHFCETCGKAFNMASDLSKHKGIHTQIPSIEQMCEWGRESDSDDE
jgi:hypothetical protein